MTAGVLSTKFRNFLGSFATLVMRGIKTDANTSVQEFFVFQFQYKLMKYRHAQEKEGDDDVEELWKEKDEKIVIDEDEEAVEKQEDYETTYRHEENAGEIVMGQSKVVEGLVRKKDNARKAQRKSKEERMKMAEIERKEELKRLKNGKKKEIKEKIKKVLSIDGFKDGEEFPLVVKDLDDEFDPEEYDKMMKAVFDDDYYGAEDSDLNSDKDDGEKPDFDKEDELLGLPKDWGVIQGGDGFIAARKKVLKHMENGA